MEGVMVTSLFQDPVLVPELGLHMNLFYMEFYVYLRHLLGLLWDAWDLDFFLSKKYVGP